MENIFNNVNNYIIAFNNVGKIQFCNDKLLLRLKYSLYELMGENIYNKVRIFKDEYTSTSFKRDPSKFLGKPMNFKFISKENQVLDLKGKIFSSTRYNEELYFVICEEDKINIIYQKELENTLINKLYKDLNDEFKRRREAEKELEIILETATDLMTIVDANGYFIRTGMGWDELLEWKNNDLLNINLKDLFHPDDLEEALSEVKSAKEEERLGKGISRCRCKNGEYKIFSWRIIYVKERDIYIGSGTDITEEKRLEKERRKYEEAFMSESIKNEFFANMSHEFKTPLNIIFSAIQLIDYGIINKFIKNTPNIKLANYINSIKQNCYRLLRLVNNIIDMTRIDTGYYNLHLENCNIISVIEDIVSSVSEYVKGKNIDIIFDPEVEEMNIACDTEKIERIMLNLISNAIKYTNQKGQGKIEITLKIKEDVIITVKDNGIGIPEDELKIIFDRFKQVDNSFTRKTEGSGIGLSLAKSLVKLHGGEIWVNSQVNKGTEFSFTIPIRKIEKESQKNVDLGISSHIDKCNIEFSDIYDI